MQHPRGIAVILGLGIALAIIVLAVIGVVYYGASTKNTQQTVNQNTNAIKGVVNLSCTKDVECATYCGIDSCYKPYCNVTAAGSSCACSYTCEPVPANNDNTNVNRNTNQSTNANANTNSSVSTAGWKTYTNSSQGYSVKYPSDWVTQVIDKETGAESATGEVTTFWSKANYKKLIPDGTEWVPTDTLYYFRVIYKDASAAANAKDPNTKKLSSIAINVGGVAGVKEVYQGAYGKWTVVYVAKGGVTYGLYLPDKNTDQQAIATTLLSTFTFTK